MLTSARRGETLTPNPNECNSTLTSGTNNIYPYPYIDVNDRGHGFRSGLPLTNYPHAAAPRGGGHQANLQSIKSGWCPGPSVRYSLGLEFFWMEICLLAAALLQCPTSVWISVTFETEFWLALANWGWPSLLLLPISRQSIMRNTVNLNQQQ